MVAVLRARAVRRLRPLGFRFSRRVLSEKPAVVCLPGLAAGLVDALPPAPPAAPGLEQPVLDLAGCVRPRAGRLAAAHGRQFNAAVAAFGVGGSGTGRPAAARRGGVFQLVRHHDVRLAGAVCVARLFRHELRLAGQAGRARGLFQPVLSAGYRLFPGYRGRIVHTGVALGDYAQIRARPAGGYQLGGRAYAVLVTHPHPVPALAGCSQKLPPRGAAAGSRTAGRCLRFRAAPRGTPCLAGIQPLPPRRKLPLHRHPAP